MKPNIIRIIAIVIFAAVLLGVTSQDTPASIISNASLQISSATTSTCEDSDGGINYEVAGTISGVGANGWAYSRDDVCETGDYEGYLKEFFCVDTSFSARRYLCLEGCLDGACVTEPVVCTDVDGDTFAVEGGLCGPVDCNDTDPLINPGVDETCGNGTDDNCDGLTDEEDPVCLVCTDADGDGYAFEGGACGPVDCDDSLFDVNPGVVEVCDNGIDDNCNGKVDGDDPACGSTPNIIVIGWDGTQRDHLMECVNGDLPECSVGLPNLYSLGSGEILSTTITSGDTTTKPGWAQILSGYTADVMGIYSNGLYQPLPENYSVFEKLENHFGPENIVTMFISGKSVNTGAACVGDPTTVNGQPAIEDQGQPWCITKDFLDYYENDLRLNSIVGNRALDLLEAHKDDIFFAFFLFRTPDVIGHLAGENSIQYSESIIDDDVWLGMIMEKLQDLGISDRTLVYVTTDHGFDEGMNRHGNAPFTFMVTNDPLVSRGGNRLDIAPTILERYGIGSRAMNGAPVVDGFSMYSMPPYSCVPEGEAYIDYPGSPVCCSGLTLISLDKIFGKIEVPATGGAGDNSGYCTACGDGVCVSPENAVNCPADCN